MSEKLRSDLEEGRAVGEYRIYVELPKNEDHTGHVAGEVSCNNSGLCFFRKKTYFFRDSGR